LPAGSASTLATFKPYAYLVVQDEKGTRYPITNTTWRIGRTRDNELTLPDKSVSRRHAEIHRYSNGTFIVFDVDSLNGVYVNDEKIKKKKLEEGDILEIGDIVMRFTLFSSDYASDEDTAVQNTRTPSVN
jgi:adenylate cyclase